MRRRVLVGVLLVAVAVAGVVAYQRLRTSEPVDHDVVAVLRAGADTTGTPDSPADLTERIHLYCPDCRVVTTYADSDPRAQARQFRRVLADGADVVILEPVAPERAEKLVVSAGPVPVVALGSVVPGASSYAGPHERALGRRLGRAVASGARPGEILVIEPPLASAGVTAGLDVGLNAGSRLPGGGREQIRLEANPAATREETRDWVAGQLASPRPEPIAAIVAVGPAQSLGVLDALSSVPEADRPAVATTGDGLEELRGLVRGETEWSAHLDRDAEQDAAAQLAVSAVVDGVPAPDTVDYQGVPSVLTQPEIITLDNLAETMVRHHGVVISQLCDRRTHDACEAAGLL